MSSELLMNPDSTPRLQPQQMTPDTMFWILNLSWVPARDKTSCAPFGQHKQILRLSSNKHWGRIIMKQFSENCSQRSKLKPTR